MTEPHRLDRRRLLAAGAGAGIAATLSSGPTGARARAARSITSDSIRAIYLNPWFVDSRKERDLLDLIDRTELNAIVVDVKESGIYVDTNVPLFRESGGVNTSLYDVDALLQAMHDRGIYSIARLVTFRDDYIPRQRPDLAVLDEVTGKPWESYDGLPWLNPLKQELWEANADFAVELARRGFDEIQFDYVRFPSDGDLSRMDFGMPIDNEAKTDLIADFLGYCRERISPTGAMTAADVFGYTMLHDDIGIGQDARKMARSADYLCPMVYPSHYPDGSVNVPGQPNDFPYETIFISLELGSSRVPPHQLRPWIQDFSLEGMRNYGPADIRAQMKACYDGGASGWMLWSILSEFTIEALLGD
jgi:hypothetical protein